MVHSISEYQGLVEKCKQRGYPIVVKFGLEVCYEEGCEKMIEEVRNAFNWDFLTGSVHWIDGWGFDHNKEDWFGRNVNSLYTKYYEKMLALVRSKQFDHLAHPDSIKCFGHLPTINLKNQYLSLARELRLSQMRAEFSCGLSNNYGHPEIGLNRTMLEIFKTAGVSMITASDAHCPEDVGKGIAEAEKILSSLSSSDQRHVHLPSH